MSHPTLVNLLIAQLPLLELNVYGMMTRQELELVNENTMLAKTLTKLTFDISSTIMDEAKTFGLLSSLCTNLPNLEDLSLTYETVPESKELGIFGITTSANIRDYCWSLPNLRNLRLNLHDYEPRWPRLHAPQLREIQGDIMQSDLWKIIGSCILLETVIVTLSKDLIEDHLVSSINTALSVPNAGSCLREFSCQGNVSVTTYLFYQLLFYS